MGDPREAFRDIQRRLQNSRRGGNFPGGPRNFLGLGTGVAIVVGGYILVNNALFNGVFVPFNSSATISNSLQSTEDIERSSTLE